MSNLSKEKIIQKTRFSFVVGVICLIVWTCKVFGGIDGLTISVHETNVVLSWPSSGTENYLIQYRSTLSTNSTWITLTNNLPAAIGTNRTTFLIFGVIPPLTLATTNSDGDATKTKSVAEQNKSNGMETSLDDKTILFLTKNRIFPPYVWDKERRPPYPWELEVRPPYPWEAEALKTAEKLSKLQSTLNENVTIESNETTTETQVGFSSVFFISSTLLSTSQTTSIMDQYSSKWILRITSIE